MSNSVFGISLGDNKEQQELVRLIKARDVPVIICTGNAGTGKTMITIATALELKENKLYNKIIYTRNPVEVGKSLGYLKGSLDDKFQPYMAPLYDAIDSIVWLTGDKKMKKASTQEEEEDIKIKGKGKKRKARVSSSGNVNGNDLLQKIDVEPLGFLRGRNFAPGTILIVDECQNLNLASLKTVLTRMSDYCKVILLGSMNQIDDTEQRKATICDFQKVINKFTDLQTPYVGMINLERSMRSTWCVDIDRILGEIDHSIEVPSGNVGIDNEKQKKPITVT